MGTAIFGRAKQRLDLNYTPRQLAILNEEIPFDKISRNELTLLIKKTEARADKYNYGVAKLMYEVKCAPNTYRPNMTYKEAKEILQSLTPWKIIWEI